MHVAEQVPVAAKLVTAEHARVQHFRDALVNEVRAMARLDHPGIVMVLDYGAIPEDSAQRSDNVLVAGSPYIVMELVAGASLKAALLGMTWDRVHHILLALLDALGHAHARGVIHRDIKPSNILLSPTSSGHPQAKLTDFGIAYALDVTEDDGGEPLTAGTPWYMAPEQIMGRTWDQGPPTDLYALGCVAYQLVTGHPPFTGRDRDDVCRAHCLGEVPPLAPLFGVPSDLLEWMQMVLAKHPWERFGTAADAAHALRGLGGTEVPPTGRPPVADDDEDSQHRFKVDASTIAATSTASSGFVRGLAEQSASFRLGGDVVLPVRGRPEQWAVPPFPETWQRQEGERMPLRLLGAGLGLYGLRPVPIAGRRAERDALWSALAGARSTGTPAVVVLTGAAGHGKSRLAQWLVERAHEAGVSAVLRASHGPSPASGHGLDGMLTTYLRVEGLPPTMVSERVAAILAGEEDAIESARLRTNLVRLVLAGTRGAQGARGHVHDAAERHAVLADLLAHVSSRSCAVLVVDDAQWGSDSIAFVDHLVRTRRLPVLVVVTVDDDALADRPAEAAQISRLDSLPGVVSLPILPLEPGDHAELVQRLLRLEGDVARLVEERTSGNPMFAVQLVGHWIQGGRLALGTDGWELAEGSTPTMPDDVHSLWTERVDRLLATVSGGDRASTEGALEIAAVLGHVVVREEWLAACEQAGLAVPDGLLDLMAVRSLAMVEGPSWRFVHGMLRESLERRSREGGRWEARHDACARMLASAHPDPTGEISGRIGRHLFLAGRFADSLEPSLAGARHRTYVSDYREADALFSMYDEALDRVGAAEDDLRWTLGWMARAEALSVRARIEDAQQALDRAEPGARAAGKADVLAEIAWLEGVLAHKRGDPARSQELLLDAMAAMQVLGDELGIAHCHHGLAETRKLLGDREGARRDYDESVRRFEELDEPLWLGRSLAGLADLAFRGGDLDGAAELADRAIDVLGPTGNRHTMAAVINGLGDIRRQQGRLEEAGALYEDAAATLDEIGSEEAALVRVNYALVSLARGRYEEASAELEGVREVFLHAGREGFMAFVHAAALPCAAHAGRWDRFDKERQALDPLLARIGIADEDLAWCVERAGDLAAQEGRSDEARWAYGLTVRQWEQMGRADEAERLRATLAALPS